MAVIVQKYGGTSVADVQKIGEVARKIAARRAQGDDLVVVVSAMGHTTDELLALARQVTVNPPRRELDMLLTAGERISMALLSMALNALGVPAISFTGSQSGIITSDSHANARIVEVRPYRIQDELERGAVVIVAGFQGVSYKREVTTLGRGGSDTTAVALAAALGAESCEIYTDVDGVFTADPRIVPTAQRIPRISYEEMLEMAACGAKVLHLRAVEYARRHELPIHVRSSFSQRDGTFVVAVSEEEQVEQAIISGVAHDRSEAKVTVVGVPDKPGEAAGIFAALADADINIDMIVQNVSGSTGRTDISFTLPKSDGQTAMTSLEKVKAQIGFESLLYDDHIGKVSLVGAGMKSHPGVSKTFFEALAQCAVNVEIISTSEIRISVLVRDTEVDLAVRALHDAFELGGTEEAVVYAGTGR